MNAIALKKIVVAALLVACTGTPALAQRMGSANRNAPQVTQGITLGAAKLDLNYTSITWASGQWAAQLANDASKAAFRDNLNAAAAKAPLGALTTTAAFTIGGQKVEAGTYKLAFTLDDKYQWQITLSNDAGSVVIPLPLKTVEEDSRRLVTSLRAGEQDFTAEIVVAFGKSRCALPVSAAK